MKTAIDFLRDIGLQEADLKGDLKVFQSTHGNGPGKPAGSLKDIQRNAEQAEHHTAMAQQHSDFATSAKSQGNRTIASLHSDAAEHHVSLSGIHTNLAAAHAQKAKSAVKPLSEAFVTRGYKNANDLVDFSKYDMSKSPSSRGEGDNPRPKLSVATVQDMVNVANMVAAKHGARTELVRSLGENGFVAAIVLQPGLYLGQTAPSIPAVEAELVAGLRNVAPVASVDLITQDEIHNPTGPSNRRGIFRFRLRNHDAGGF